MSLSRREWENHLAHLHDRITFSHLDEINPSVENGKDFSLTKGNGVHFKLCKGLVSDFQITARLDKSDERHGAHGRNEIGLFTFNRRRTAMRLSFIVAVVIASAVGVSATICFHCPVWAQAMPPSGPGAKPGAQQSIKEATGQLKMDTGKTTDDVKAMDVNKAKQDAGQVKTDAQGLKDSAKGMLTKPFGK